MSRTRWARFNEDDRQFAEIFGRSVALALNMLNLLVVERYTTSGKVTDSVVQEMSQPLNDIASEAQALMEDYIGDDSMRDRLRGIAGNVEVIRHALRDVAAGPNVVLGLRPGRRRHRARPRARRTPRARGRR